MSPALAAFLAEEELDRLAAAREAVGTPSAEDAAAIARTLREWADVQAVANLLMHPELIGESCGCRRCAAGSTSRSTRTWRSPRPSGSSACRAEQLVETEREAFVDALLERIAGAPGGPLAGRASVTLASLLDEDDAERAAGLLDHPDRTVKHNVLVALVGAVGVDAIGPFLAAAEARGAVSEAGGTFADLELAELERSGRRGLGAPLLTYIPNLRDTGAG